MATTIGIILLFIHYIVAIKNVDFINLEGSGSSAADEKDLSILGECKPDEQLVNGTNLSWSRRISEIVYHSIPFLCLDKRKLYIQRSCNTSWDKQPTCDYLQSIDLRKNIRCPPSMTEIIHKNKPLCLTISPPASYAHSKCPFNYNLFNYAEMKDVVAPILKNTLVWIDVTRFEMNGIVGQMVVAEKNAKYGESTEIPRLAYNEMHLCAALRNGEITFIACTANASKVCVYNPRLDWQYCRWTDITCINKDMHTESLACICPTAKKCAQPAELTNPNQNVGLFSLKACDLNLRIDDNDTLLWSKSLTSVDATFWSILELRPKFEENARFLWKGFGWTYAAEQSECTICEQPFRYLSPRLNLRQTGDKLDLIVLGSDSIYRSWLHNVFCFIDADGIQRISSTRFGFQGRSFSESGTYWCEAFEIKHFQTIRSNTVNAVFDNIYILEITAEFKGDDDPRGQLFRQALIANVTGIANHKPNIRYLNLTEVSAISRDLYKGNFLLRILLAKNDANYNSEYHKLLKDIKTISSHNTINGLYNLQFCKSFTNNVRGVDYVWKEARAGELSIADKYCVDKFGNIINITCVGSFHYGARFTTPQSCNQRQQIPDEEKSDYTEDLQNLDNSTKPPEEIIDALKNISKHSNEFQPVDIYLVGNLLHKHEQSIDLNDILRVTSNVMHAKSQTLKESQLVYNATDKILYTMDLGLGAFTLRNGTQQILTHPNLITFAFDPCASHYAGAAYVGNNQIVPIPSSASLDEITQIHSMKAAIYITQNSFVCQHLEYLIMMTFYMNSALFNAQNYFQTASLQVGVVLPLAMQNDIQVQVVFDGRHRKSQCAYWRYGAYRQGTWAVDGTNAVAREYFLCTYNHTTHFGQLIAEGVQWGDQSFFALDTLTIIETILSAFGIGAFYCTGIIFKEWRLQAKNQFLLHYCNVLLLQMVALYLSDHEGIAEIAAMCIAVGAVLHFSVISQFAWTLLISLNQYQRYVLVVQRRVKIDMRRRVFYAYLSPSLLVSITVIFFSDTYLQNSWGMCYPSGALHSATVLLPVVFVVCCNLYVFALILKSIAPRWRGKREGLHCKNLDLYIYIRLTVLLFFILGLTWTFGILANLLHDEILLYLFSILVSIQGFIIFLFFIVLDKNVMRMYWRHINTFKFNYCKR